MNITTRIKSKQCIQTQVDLVVYELLRAKSLDLYGHYKF